MANYLTAIESTYCHQLELMYPEGMCFNYIQKAMCGLNQTPHMWNRHLNDTPLKMPFKRSQLDPCVYFKREGDLFQVLATVVDDIILASSILASIDLFAKTLRSLLAITNLGRPSHLVGLNITLTGDAIHLDQNQFVKDLQQDK